MTRPSPSAEPPDTLAPWRDWLHQHHAFLRPGPVQAWGVEQDERKLQLEVEPRARGVAAVRVLVMLADGHERLSIVPINQALNKLKRVFTGDAEFDESVVIHVPETRFYGVFTAPTRHLIATLLNRGVICCGGALRLEPWASATLPPNEVAVVLDGMQALAGALQITTDAARAAIAAIIDADPMPSVRATYERAFGQASDIRDARARLRRDDSGFQDRAERLPILLQQAADRSLSLAARQDVCSELLDGYPLDRSEPAFAGLPLQLYGALFELLVEHLERTTSAEERRAGARITAIFLAESSPSLTAELRGRAVRVLAPLGEMVLLDVFLDCIERSALSLVREGWRGLLYLPLSLTELERRMKNRDFSRMRSGLPELFIEEPALIQRHVAALFSSIPDTTPDLQLHYLAAFAAAANVARERGTFSTADWRDILAIVRHLVALDALEIKVAAILALGALGDVSDLSQLRPLTEGLFRSSRIKDAARAAATSIQERERISDVEGALALSNGDVGALALPDD